MEKVISKIVKYAVDNKFPEFTDVNVTSEYDYSNYNNRDKNIVINYSVFLTIKRSDFEPINNNGEWDKFKSNILELIQTIGITNSPNIYVNFSDEGK